MHLRELNEKGTQEYQRYLEELIAGRESHTEVSKLLDESYSDKLGDYVVESLADDPPALQMDFAKYLTELFAEAGLPGSEAQGKSGLWNWLAIRWFNAILGQGKINTDLSRYILTRDQMKLAGFGTFRHLLRTPWLVYYMYGEKSRVLIGGRDISTHGDMLEQVVQRRDLITNPNMMELVYRLYFDRARDGHKKNASADGIDGSVRRLKDFMAQLEMTYDLQSITTEEMYNLLPAEFDSWK